MIKDYVYLTINLEELTGDLISDDFPGICSNQDMCLDEWESGFERNVYDKDDKFLVGYNITLSQENNKSSNLSTRSHINCLIFYYDYDWDSVVKEDNFKISLNTSLSKVREKILSKINKKIKKFLK